MSDPRADGSPTPPPAASHPPGVPTARQEVSTQIPQTASGEKVIGPGVTRRRTEAVGGTVVEWTEPAAPTEFMKRVVESTGLHDDQCPSARGKECSCRDNLRAIAEGELEELERVTTKWTVATYRKATHAERAVGLKTVKVPKECSAELARVDGGKTVTKEVPDPVSATSKRMVEVQEFLPARWICLACAMSFRGTDFDHRCDDTDLMRANRPVGLERTITPEVRFGGGYKLTIERNAEGEYLVGEMVVVNGRVMEERLVYGPEGFDVVQGAILDAVASKLSP